MQCDPKNLIDTKIENYLDTIMQEQFKHQQRLYHSLKNIEYSNSQFVYQKHLRVPGRCGLQQNHLDRAPRIGPVRSPNAHTKCSQSHPSHSPIKNMSFLRLAATPYTQID